MTSEIDKLKHFYAENYSDTTFIWLFKSLLSFCL